MFEAKGNGVFGDNGFTGGRVSGNEDALMTLQMQNSLLLEDVQLEGPLVRHFWDTLMEIVHGFVDDVDVHGPFPVAGLPIFRRVGGSLKRVYHFVSRYATAVA